MRTRLFLTLLALALAATLAGAPAALAHNDGRGFLGATEDLDTTYVGLALIIFFPLFIFAMSRLQRRLDKRKDARKAAHKAQLGDARWRGGW
jgi:TRAP-type C4-dicarboxylate transport system permease small subunit